VKGPLEPILAATGISAESEIAERSKQDKGHQFETVRPPNKAGKHGRSKTL